MTWRKFVEMEAPQQAARQASLAPRSLVASTAPLCRSHVRQLEMLRLQSAAVCSSARWGAAPLVVGISRVAAAMQANASSIATIIEVFMLQKCLSGPLEGRLAGVRRKPWPVKRALHCRFGLGPALLRRTVS